MSCADYSEVMETNTDPFENLQVAHGERFAGQGQADDDAKFDRQYELAAWLVTQTWSSFAVDLADFFNKRGYLTERQEASATSMRNKCEARNAPTPTNPVTEDGIYRNADGDIFKCVHNQTGTSMYAKQLTSTGHFEDVDITDKSGDVVRTESREKFSWEYANGAIYRLSADMRVSEEDARQFGRITGTCCLCGRYLTAERSVENGIGPVCEAKF